MIDPVDPVLQVTPPNGKSGEFARTGRWTATMDDLGKEIMADDLQIPITEHSR